MPDPREALGHDVHKVQGPYALHRPENTGGALGGTLDRGILGRAGGFPVVVGETWAKAPAMGKADGVRVDSVELGERIVHLLRGQEIVQEATEMAGGVEHFGPEEMEDVLRLWRGEPVQSGLFQEAEAAVS